MRIPFFIITFARQLRKSINLGEVLEWLKRHAWKACNRQNRFAGSNPVLSARKGFKDIPGFTLLNVKPGIIILSRLLSSFRNQVFGNYEVGMYSLQYVVVGCFLKLVGYNCALPYIAKCI